MKNNVECEYWPIFALATNMIRLEKLNVALRNLSLELAKAQPWPNTQT